MDKPVAIVTGGSRGIGRAIVLGLAEGGYDVAVGYRSNAAAAEETRADAAELGAACEIFQVDIAERTGRDDLVAGVKAKFGRCNLLVNNAGVAPAERQDILEAGEDSFDRVMRVNLKGPYFLTQTVANWMLEQRRQHSGEAFRIVNIGSISAYTSSPGRGEYCISKAGVGMMTTLYADRLAEFDIGVFEVRPGIIQTDMTAGVQGKYDKLIADGLTPIKRCGQPADVAKAVASIASGAFDFATGQVVNVDGGFHMRRL